MADLHFGAIEPAKFREELSDIFDKIRSLDKIDYIIFLGDLFDHKMYVGDPHITNVIMFMQTIMTMAIHRGIKIRMIYGTESHECDQYILFKGYENIEDLDFKIIKEVSEEDLFDDLRVLYVPEEYITESKGEYYREYFEKNHVYDYIFGHGVIMEGMIMIKTDQNSQWTMAKSPKFVVDDFHNCLKGEVYFGHFHVREDITNQIHYVGSYSRWCHGEEHPKGFTVVTKDDNSYTNEFIENPSADMYKTIGFGYEHPIFNEEIPLENHISGIERMIDVYPERTRIRLIINIPDNYKNPEFFMAYLKDKYRMHPFITLEFVNGYIDKKRQQSKEELHNNIERYSYILKKEDDIGATVSKFIKDKKGKEIAPEKITFYLTQTLQDILIASTDQ